MQIEKEIIKIKERNTKVEKEKAWETSKTRTTTICIITYLIILAFNKCVNLGANVYLSSSVPVIGYFLSTLAMPGVRKIWEKKS